MNKRILAVDDSVDVLALTAPAFAHEGFIFIAVRSYVEMRAALDETLPDLIIVDLLLPDVTGYQILEELHSEQRTADIPIIVVTTKSEEIYRRISADLGAARHAHLGPGETQQQREHRAQRHAIGEVVYEIADQDGHDQADDHAQQAACQVGQRGRAARDRRRAVFF